MEKLKLATTDAVVFRSLNPDDPDSWFPLFPEEVPEKIKELDVMGNLISGNIADIGDDYWYRAEDVSELIREEANTKSG